MKTRRKISKEKMNLAKDLIGCKKMRVVEELLVMFDGGELSIATMRYDECEDLEPHEVFVDKALMLRFLNVVHIETGAILEDWQLIDILLNNLLD